MPTSHLPIINAASPIQRQAMYIGSAEAPLFAVLHSDKTAAPRNCITVICPPLGYEYTHSHRSVRHLADALACNGIPALRFDYHGTGDSLGTDLDPDRLARWLQDIRVAINEARTLSGGAPVCLLGIRMGATLAAMIAAEVEVDSLVMWFPATSGRRYVREQQAISQTMLDGERPPDAPLEAAGFMLTRQTQESLKAIDLLKMPSKARAGVLLIQRDDLGEEHSLRDHLAAQGLSIETITCPGFVEMMAQPLYTQVPQVAIDATVRWLAQHSTTPAQLYLPEARPVEMQYDFTSTDGKQVELADLACRFGESDYLFGIHTRSTTPQAELPTVVMFNSGVVHRVGPGRLYTLLARNMAALGFPVFRCDIEGIGDSILRASGRENHPYPDGALNDAETVLAFLRERFGAKQFVVMGLCSGAYVSFMTGINENNYPIAEIILINPLTFHWKEGDRIDTDHFGQVAYYRESMRSGSSWKKLLRGQVNVLNVGKVVASHISKQLKSQTRSLVERVYPKAGSLLANQLRSLYARKRHISLFISSGDPGWDMLTTGAREAVRHGMKRGAMSMQMIANADHTFSGEDARLRMVTSVCEHLQLRHSSALKNEARPEVIVLSRTITGLETVRCLGQAGIKVHAIYFKRYDAVKFSRYCRANFFDDEAKDEQALLSHLIAYTQKLGTYPIVVPTCDSHALLLANNREMLRPYCRVMTAEYSSLANVIHKHNLHTQAELAGVDIVPSIVAPNLDQITTWSALHEAPYLVKPFYTGVSTSRLTQKNIVLTSREALLAYVSEGDMQSLIVQRMIPGGDGYIFDCYGYCNTKGEVVALASKRRLRQYLPDYGTCSMGEIPAYLDETTQATIFANTKQLFSQVKYNGIFGVEWLYDRSAKKFYIIDFNARPFMSIGHVSAAGLNLPALAYADMVGDDLSHVEQMPRLKHLIGVDLMRDMESFQLKLIAGKLSTKEWLGSLLKCRYFYYSDWRDPGPAVIRMQQIIFRVFFYLVRKNAIFIALSESSKSFLEYFSA